jgi:hypothetical protein
MPKENTLVECTLYAPSKFLVSSLLLKSRLAPVVTELPVSGNITYVVIPPAFHILEYFLCNLEG